MESLRRPAKVLFSYNPKYFNFKIDMGLGISYRTNLNLQIEEDIWEDWEHGSEEYRRLVKNYIIKGIRNLVVQLEVIGQLGREIGLVSIPLISNQTTVTEKTFHGCSLLSYGTFLRRGNENQWNVDRIPEFENLNTHYHL